MPVVTASESSPFLDEGMYPATVMAITEEEGQFGPQFKFTWVLDGKFHEKGDKAGQPIDIWDWCSQKLTPKSKLWQVATSLNVQPVLGQGFDTDDLLGRRANLVIKHVDTTSGPKAKIVDMLKVGGAAPAAVPAGAVEQEWCHVCTLKGKRTPLAKYAATGEPLCDVHDDDDLK